MRRGIALGIALSTLGAAGTARADLDVEAPSGAIAQEAAGRGIFSPYTTSPLRDDAAVVSVTSGWDTAYDDVRFTAVGEVRVWRTLRLRGGAVYADGAERLRPTIGGVWQAIEGERNALAIAVDYRPEGFTEPEGEIELTIAMARRFGAGVAILDLVYGQDPEGRERDAEALAAVVRTVGGHWAIGADVRGRVAITTPDSGPEADAVFDLVAGPVVTRSFARWAITGHAGISVVGVKAETRVGALGVLGVGVPF